MRGLAKLSTEGNKIDSCFSKGSEKLEVAEEEKEMTSNDEIDEPVSPPACSEDEYPRLVFSGERETPDGSCITTQAEVPGVMPAHQQKLSGLRSQLLFLSPLSIVSIFSVLLIDLTSSESCISILLTLRSSFLLCFLAGSSCLVTICLLNNVSFLHL